MLLVINAMRQPYTNTSGIEAEFFEMFKYALVHSWKGAYHMNPDYSHWYGWAQINLDLEKIKSQNSTLRRIAEIEKSQKTMGKGTKATPVFGHSACSYGHNGIFHYVQEEIIKEVN